MKPRLYLDWNATTPLRPEARAAMAGAMDIVGNPSSVHAEGRAARAAIERARAQIAAALGAGNADIVFTSGATEAASLAHEGRDLACAPIEHDAVLAWCRPDLTCDTDGRVALAAPAGATLQLANSETGVVQDLPPDLAVSDLTQAFGKLAFGFDWLGIEMGFVSAHKLGGPKGIGALVLRRGTDVAARLRGGGQEMGRRAGTENLIGIAGFGAAAEAAAAELAAGRWEEIAQFRNILESALSSGAKKTIFVGNRVGRLPNTSCVLCPGWRGETQVMQMDLAGYAISAGSACSSGKVRPSKVLQSMGFGDDDAACAIRISLGLGITCDEVLRFADVWLNAQTRLRTRTI